MIDKGLLNKMDGDELSNLIVHYGNAYRAAQDLLSLREKEEDVLLEIITIEREIQMKKKYQISEENRLQRLSKEIHDKYYEAPVE